MEIEMSNPWKESGAVVYVALTVAIFSAVTMCCVWVVKRQRTHTNYTSVKEEEMELTRVECPRQESGGKESEDILFEQTEGPPDVGAERHPDESPAFSDESPAFTLDDSDDEELPSVDQTTPV